MIKVVCGLGNPGSQYESTPHNAGFACVDAWAEERWSSCKNGLQSSAPLAEGSLSLLKPQTYMNVSAAAVQPLLAKRGWSPLDLMVVYDDADVPVGRIRATLGGGARGHNGLRSIIGTVGANFWRLGVGVGRDPVIGLGAYVLKKMHPSAWKVIEDVCARIWIDRENIFSGCEKRLAESVRSINVS